MPSTYSDLLRIEKMANGEQDTTWGTQANNVFEMLEDAIAGRAAVTHDDTANYTLTTANGTEDEARKMILNIGGALGAARNVVVPTSSKLYVAKNATTGGFATTLKTTAGTGISVPNGKTTLLFCDGTNVVDAIDYLSSLTVGGALSVTPANANVTLSPTGTGTVTIAPATAGAMNNVVIGASTPLAGTFTTLDASGSVTATSGAFISKGSVAGNYQQYQFVRSDNTGFRWAVPAIDQLNLQHTTDAFGAVATDLITISNAGAVSFNGNVTLGDAVTDAHTVNGTLTFEVPGGSSWIEGIDNSAADSYKICLGSALGTNDYLVIDTAGAVIVGASAKVSAERFSVQAGVNGDFLAWLRNTDGTSPYGIAIDFSGAAPDNNTNVFARFGDSGAIRCYIYSDGDLQNHDNSYGAISDRRLKQHIEFAGSQWADIKALGHLVSKYKMLSDVDQYGEDAKVMLGAYAQDVLKVSPGLVQHHVYEARYDEEGELISPERDEFSLQYSIWYMKGMKALGEVLDWADDEVKPTLENHERRIGALEARPAVH